MGGGIRGGVVTVVANDDRCGLVDMISWQLMEEREGSIERDLKSREHSRNNSCLLFNAHKMQHTEQNSQNWSEVAHWTG